MLSLQAAYALLAAGRGERHLEGEQKKNEGRKGLDNAKREHRIKSCEKNNQKLRLYRARRDLTRAGYKVQDISRDHSGAGYNVEEIREKHCRVGDSCQGETEEDNGQRGDKETIFVTPLFGTKVGSIINGETEEVEKIVKTVVSDLIEKVVEGVGEEEVVVDKGRKRSRELVVGGEGKHPNKQPRINEEKNQKSPQYKAEESEEEEEHEVVDIADEDEEDAEAESEGEEVMEVSDEEHEDIFINPFHQPDLDNEDDEVEVTREVAAAEPEDEIEVTGEVAADPRAALERAASKKLEAVKR